MFSFILFILILVVIGLIYWKYDAIRFKINEYLLKMEKLRIKNKRDKK